MATTYSISFRVRWDKYSNKQQGFPIYMEFKVPGIKRPKSKNTGKYLQKREYWDVAAMAVKRQCPEHSGLNDFLAKKRAELSKRLLKDELLDKPITANSHTKKEITSFFDYIKAVRSKLKKTKHVKRKTTNIINNIREFHGSEPSILEINAEWLREYETYLIEDMNYKQNSINSLFKVLRRVTNQAALEKHIEAPVIGKGYYPTPKAGKTKPVFLIQQEREKLLKGLLNNEIENPNKRRTLLYFMLSCYSGLRFCDVVKFNFDEHVIGDITNKNAKNNTLYLFAEKNDESVVLPITYGSSLWKILSLIRLAGPLRKEYSLYRQELKEIIAHFKINKKVTPHVGRHSFGRLCAERDISIFDCAYYMGIGVKVCEVYYHITGKLRNKRNAKKLAA